MFKIKLNLSCGELIIEFADTEDLKNQLGKIDFAKIESLFNAKDSDEKTQTSAKVSSDDAQTVKDLGTVNLLKISERGMDAIKLAVFLASCGINKEQVRKITGVTILS